MQKTVLIVDDEQRIREMVREHLVAEGFMVEEAGNGMEALEKMEEKAYNCIVLDIMMPKLDGWATCREIRKRGNVPVIMLSARGEEYDKLFGFELGVDDYVVKPFSPRELVARVKAVMSRTEAKMDSELSFDGLIIDSAGRSVTIDSKAVQLSPKEFDLLACLAKNKGIALSRDQLLNEVWGYDFYGDYRTVDTHIKAVRNAIGRYRSCIVTVWGTGYKFEWRKET